MLAFTLAMMTFASAWSNSLVCRDGGATAASASTAALGGPDGAIAVLRVSSADDHRKQTHLCLANYEFSVTHTSSEIPVAVSFLSTDAAWGRRLSVSLDGYSGDGKTIFGVLRESGRNGFTALLTFDADDRKAHLVLLPRGLAARSGCAGDVSVVATAGIDALVQPACGGGRWLVTSSHGRLPSYLRGFPDGTWDDLSIGRLRRLRADDPAVPLRERRSPAAVVDSPAPRK